MLKLISFNVSFVNFGGWNEENIVPYYYGSDDNPQPPSAICKRRFVDYGEEEFPKRGCFNIDDWR